MKKAVLLMMALFAGAQFLAAQTWTKTIAPSNSWQCVASSADGSHLVAGQDPGPLYLSTNSGATWTPTIVSNEYWFSVASSADGTKLVAVAPDNAPYNSGNYAGGIYISTNGGCTWVSNSISSLNMGWDSVASSADGNTLAAVASYSPSDGYFQGAVFSSTDGGNTWVSNSLISASSVAMSADGIKMVAVGYQVWLSTNSGVAWATNAAAPAIGSSDSAEQCIASSADGNKLVLCTLPQVIPYNPAQDLIYVSTNFGGTWNLTSAPADNWNYVASSADGKTLLAAPVFTRAGAIWCSTNSGATWSTNNSPVQDWGALASSADGGLLIAVESTNNFDPNTGGGVIYTSQSIQSPCMNIAPANGNLMLSWLTPSTDFVLEQRLDLINWLNVTNTPVLNLNNLQDEVVLQSTNNLNFYRLATP